jgi:hypothetical protein
VLDGFRGFARALGIEDFRLQWDLPLPAAALDYAAQLIPETPGSSRGTLVISACSSHARRAIGYRAPCSGFAADAVRARGGACESISAGGPRGASDATWPMRSCATPVYPSSTKSAGARYRNRWPLLARARAPARRTRASGRAHGDDGRHTGDRA